MLIKKPIAKLSASETRLGAEPKKKAVKVKMKYAVKWWNTNAGRYSFTECKNKVEAQALLKILIANIKKPGIGTNKPIIIEYKRKTW